MTVREFDEVCKKMGNVNFVFSFDDQPRGTVPANMTCKLQFTKVVCMLKPNTVRFIGASGFLSISNVDYISCNENGRDFTIFCKGGECVVINTSKDII